MSIIDEGWYKKKWSFWNKSTIFRVSFYLIKEGILLFYKFPSNCAQKHFCNIIGELTYPTRLVWIFAILLVWTMPTVKFLSEWTDPTKLSLWAFYQMAIYSVELSFQLKLNLRVYNIRACTRQLLEKLYKAFLYFFFIRVKTRKS